MAVLNIHKIGSFFLHGRTTRHLEGALKRSSSFNFPGQVFEGLKCAERQKALMVDYFYGPYDPRYVVMAQGQIAFTKSNGGIKYEIADGSRRIKLAIAVRNHNLVHQWGNVYVFLPEYGGLTNLVTGVHITEVTEIVSLSEQPAPPVAPPRPVAAPAPPVVPQKVEKNTEAEPAGTEAGEGWSPGEVKQDATYLRAKKLIDSTGGQLSFLEAFVRVRDNPWTTSGAVGPGRKTGKAKK